MMGDQVTKVSRVVSTTFKSNDLVIKDLDEGLPGGRVFQV